MTKPVNFTMVRGASAISPQFTPLTVMAEQACRRQEEQAPASPRSAP